MATVLEQTLTTHRRRMCQSGEGPRRLRMPSDTHVPTRPSGARVSIDKADAHATIRATQAKGLRCGL